MSSALRLGAYLLVAVLGGAELSVLWLAASPDVTEFELTLSSDEGSQVSAALPMQQPQQLGPSPTIFDWSPY